MYYIHYIQYKYLGFLDWSQFLQAIKILRVKQLNEKIDLFFKVVVLIYTNYRLLIQMEMDF